MSLITNGDFSNGLAGWTVSGAGPTAPTHDPANNRVIFGNGDNDVQDGDRLEQEVALQAGEEYTLTFSASEIGPGVGGFGLNIELIDVNGSGNTQFLDFVVVDNDDTNNITITFTSNFDDPVLRIRGAFGNGGIDSMLILDDFVLTCFTAGTRLRTNRGEVEVQDLKTGDLLVTLPKPEESPETTGAIRRIFRQTISIQLLKLNPKLQPVCIAAGALGGGRPKRDLLVSRQHRMLVQSKIAERMFGMSEVLIPAIKLTKLPGVFVQEAIEDVQYFHVLLDDHEVVFAEGTPTESLFTGPEALKSMSFEAREEILTIFPEIAETNYEPEPARYIPTGHLQKKLIARHLKNNKPLHFI